MCCPSSGQFLGSNCTHAVGHGKHFHKGCGPVEEDRPNSELASNLFWASTSPIASSVCISSLEKESPLPHPRWLFSSKPAPTCSKSDVFRLLISFHTLIWISVFLECGVLISHTFLSWAGAERQSGWFNTPGWRTQASLMTSPVSAALRGPIKTLPHPPISPSLSVAPSMYASLYQCIRLASFI